MDDAELWGDGEDDNELGFSLERREAEWIHLKEQFVSAGYRDGVDDGKEEIVQEGFDAGFVQGVARGRVAGRLLGVLRTAVAVLSVKQSTAECAPDPPIDANAVAGPAIAIVSALALRPSADDIKNAQAKVEEALLALGMPTLIPLLRTTEDA